ncbi:hypothetical protein ASD64_11390 [Mesorhizobium sp. Root157]|uniref:hypothetical protein n=1 Tax=Mesorhizobium sp. Root157 TaxID=1736477 RepID=UPI0007001BE3|nr:hypothetical protein [Mesorhizobium sp. Root157]KQZ80888.1 hypothetical protein ASD64_11390 [Mesorhizobium sp. Root157]
MAANEGPNDLANSQDGTRCDILQPARTGRATMLDLGEVLDPFRKQVIDIKDALARARYLYDGLDLILENVEDPKIRGASQEVFACASERIDAIDAMLDEFYRQLSSADRTLESHKANPRT